MAESTTETTTTGYGKRLTSSLSGIIIGIILFLSSFGVLYWNEGRTDVSSIAKNAVAVDATNPSANESLNGKLVSVYGDFTSDGTIDDGLYLNPANYIALERVVEMYSWEENSETSSNENLGGSQTDTTTYTYAKDWNANPADSSNFKEKSDHINPPKGLKDGSYKAKNVKIGQYDIDFQSVSLPAYDDLTLKAENLKLDPTTTLLQGDFIYKPINKIDTTLGQSAYNTNAPQIGDLRISYKYLPSPTTGTIFGSIQGKRITSYGDEKGNTLFRIFRTTRELAISQMHTEAVTSRWIWRVIGLLMMWFGLSSILGIVGTLLAVIPLLASISRSIISIITFIIALVFTIVTILVSQILHSWIALAVVAVLAVAAVFLIPKLLKKKEPAQNA